MEQSSQHLLLLLTFISIISVFSLGFIIKTLDNDMCWTEEMTYYKVYFALALFTMSLKFILMNFHISGRFIITFVIYILVHTVLLCALEEKVRRKSTAYTTGFLISLLLITDYIWDYGVKEVLIMYIVYTLILFGILVYISMRRAVEEKNNGYYIFSFAFILVFLSSFFMITAISDNDMTLAYTMTTIGNNAGFALVIIGFLSLTLITEHKKLALLAIEDTLTGMNNRRGLQIMLDSIIPLANRNSKCLSVIAIDIDFFKKVNDTYGHDGGDIVLQEFSKLIKQTHRKSDISCRFGGEEFVLVLPDTNKEGAQKMAEKLRTKTENYVIDIEDENIHITASFGVATRCSDIDIDAMMKDADKALYNAKFSGRNRVCHIDDNG